MQDNQYDELERDIVEDELDTQEDDNLIEHQDDPLQEELEQPKPKKDKMVWLEKREEQLDNLTRKVLLGEKTLQDIEDNPVLNKWAYKEVEKRVNKELKNFEDTQKFEQLESKLNQFEQKLSEKEKLEEEREASQLVRDFREDKGLSKKEFQETYPEFFKSFNDLKSKVGLKQAAELSLNTIIAQSESETNPHLKRRMSMPQGGSSLTKTKSNVSRSARELGSIFGITDEDFKNFSDKK